jgi:hypothetical protein
MVSRQLDFERFVDELVRFVKEGKGYPEMMGRIEEQLAAAKARHERPRTDAFRQLARYILNLRELRHLLQSGERPSSVEDCDFLKMRPIVSALVERGLLKKEALDVFRSCAPRCP